MKIFQTLAQWVFVGLNKYDNHIIENLYIRSYNGLVSNMIEQINKANFPKEPVVSGLADRVTRSFKWKRILDAKHTIKNMFTGDELPIAYVDNSQESVIDTAGDFQFETSDENAGTRTNEGIYHCIENEVRALEQSKTHPKRQVHTLSKMLKFCVFSLQYLKTVLSQSVAAVRRIELQHLERPQAILEQLKQAYAKKHRVGIDEVRRGCSFNSFLLSCMFDD
jgi:hypothetical protein